MTVNVFVGAEEKARVALQSTHWWANGDEQTTWHVGYLKWIVRNMTDT